MKLPMREKYVDEAVGVFMIFGVRADGSVDVNDGYCDIFEGLPHEAAQRVVAAQEEFRIKLYDILCTDEAENGKA